MNAFIGRLMCFVVVFPAARMSTASACDVLDLAGRDDEPRSALSDESEFHDGLESPDSEELDHVDGNIVS